MIMKIVDKPDYKKIQMFEQVQNFMCGCVSGLVQVFVQQPFEIIKVRLQTQNHHNPEYNGIADCCKKIFLDEGPMAFYKGTLVPLLGVGVLVSLQFGSNELSKGFMEQFNTNEDEPLPMKLIIASGMLVGIPSSLAITPIDHMRILVQLQHGKNNKYHGSFEAGYRIFKNHGIKGLYLGFPVTLAREILAMGTYFGFYERAMRFSSPDGQSSAQAPMAASFFNGGIAGMVSWLFTYPLDYTKTLIQADDLDNRHYKTTLQCVRERYLDQGVHTFYRGLLITMLRSFPVNAVGFLTFEYAMRLIGRRDIQGDSPEENQIVDEED